MEEHVKTELTMAGGKKKSNGHKMSCMCPICKNMMKKKRGGADNEETPGTEGMTHYDETTVPFKENMPNNDNDNDNETTAMGGSRRRSRRSRRSRRKSRRSRRSRHSRRSRRH